MFKCDQCSAVFRRKDSLIRHKKNHDGVRCSCAICTLKFSYKSGCVRHLKNVHSVVRAQSSIRRVEIATAPHVPDTPINHRQPSHGEIEIAPQIFVPDIPAGRSSTHQSVQNNVIAPRVPDTPISHRQPSHGEIEIAPQIFVP
ncbi:zinc finger protein 746-like, partial [Aphis craccivora]